MIEPATSTENQGARTVAPLNVESLSAFNVEQEHEKSILSNVLDSSTNNAYGSAQHETGPRGEGYGKIESGGKSLDTTHSYENSKNHLTYLTGNTEDVIMTVPLSSKTPAISLKTIENMYDFFFNAPSSKEVTELVYLKGGDVKDVVKEVALPPPMYSEFCREHKVPWKQFVYAKKNIQEFKEATEECDNIVKEFIIKNGLSGNYTTQFAIFTAKNLTDMKDKHEIEEKKVNVNRLLDQIEEMSGGSRKSISVDSY
jgi:hypothetical protein